MYFRCHYFVLSENSLISDRNHKLVYIDILSHLILNMTAESFVPRDRRGIRDHIGHLISVRDVPALGTSLFVVSAYLHAHRGKGPPEAGKDVLQSAYQQYRSFQYCEMDATYSRTSVS